jgi:hypothetical protein
MIKKTINYIDYNGNPRKRDCYFNLNKAEIVKMEMSTKGSFAERIQSIIDAQDQPTLIQIFEDLIQKSYGVKTVDGAFLKRKEDLEEFVSTEAYSELFMELATNAEAAAKFINGIFPADMVKELATQPNNYLEN